MGFPWQSSGRCVIGKSAPKPPDPKDTSAAQTGTSVSTSIANAFLQNTNKVGPDGTTTFDQTGDYTWTDPYTGKTYTVPRFTETVELSPEQQAIFDQKKAAEANIAGIANDQSAFLKDYLNKPLDLNNEAVESRLFDLGSKRLDPKFAAQEESLDSQLALKGLQPGSAAWSAAKTQLSEAKNDAYNQLALTGRQQAVQEALTERNQPLNEIIGLLSGSQVQAPQFSPAQIGAIPTTDNAGLINQNYQQKLQAHQQNQAQLGGLFGGIGSIFGALSDKRAKTDISKVGETDDGQKIYAYRYKSGGPMQLGLMAQEVEKKTPEAVQEGPDGLKRVDYAKALSLGSS